LLEQKFAVCMPLLMATSTFSLGKNARVLLNTVACNVSVPWLINQSLS